MKMKSSEMWIRPRSANNIFPAQSPGTFGQMTRIGGKVSFTVRVLYKYDEADFSGERIPNLVLQHLIKTSSVQKWFDGVEEVEGVRENSSKGSKNIE